MHLKTKIIGFLSVLLLFGGVASANAPQITVGNSVAGEDIEVRVSGLFANENVQLQISRPAQNSILVAAEADEFGIVRADLHNLHFRSAGSYSLYVLRDVETLSKEFHVFAGPVSAYKSEIEFHQKSVEADGEEEARFLVTLRDAYGNPVVGESVNVFSTRNEDAVIASGTSDEYGFVNGKIVSQTPGISTVSVLVGDVLLFEKPEVVFFLSDSPLLNVGSEDTSFGEYLKASLFADEKEAVYFTIENVKQEVVVGQSISAKVVARDEEGNVVPTFRGTARFSSVDDRADLPADYRFTAEDQGAHTFFLAFTFQTPGNQTLAVHALEDLRIAGEIEFKVILGGDNITVPPGEESITLLTPRPGTYRSSRVTITGETKQCAAVNLIDGPTTLTTGLAVDAKQNFLYQTPKLGDGVHVFQAICTAKETLVSNELTIRVDQTAPQNISVAVSPEGDLPPGQPFTVTITAEEPLSRVNSIFQGILTAHELQGNAFVATLHAPEEPGEFTFDVNVADVLGNEQDFASAVVIRVAGEEAENTAPTAVTNLSADSGEGKVTLYWSPAKDDTGIAQYRIEYGGVALSSGDTPVLDQFNIVPDNRTQWYVDGLSDDKEYCFQIFALDGDENESPPSETICSMTLGAAASLHVVPEPEVLEKSGSTAPFWPVIIAVLAGGGMLLLSRRRRA
jgi:hypothetical protein